MTTSVGRELQHFEDMIIVDGSSGASQALSELLSICEGKESVTIKWDGSAAIYFGRDKRGKFYLAPKSQWKKLVVTKDDIRSSLISTAKKKEDSEEEHIQKRSTLADTYDKVWDFIEAATPKDINSFFKADIMFTEKPNIIDGKYEFSPNKVTYSVSQNGLSGKMKTAEAMIAVHGAVKNLGEEEINPISQDIISKLNKNDKLIVVGSITINIRRPNQAVINQIKIDIKNIEKNKNSIETVVTWQAENYSNIAYRKDLYSYSVAYGKQKGNLDFITWLNNSKVSEPKKQKIIEFMKKRTREWKIFLDCHSRVYSDKIAVFDSLNTDYNTVLGIEQSVNGEPGGEGFVSSATGSKLVNPEFRYSADHPKFK